MKSIVKTEFVPQTPTQLDQYFTKLDGRKKPSREAFNRIIATILSYNGEPVVHLTKTWNEEDTRTYNAIEDCRDLYGKSGLLTKVSHKRKYGLARNPDAPLIPLRQDAPRTLLFRVEGPNGVLWQDHSSIDPNRVSLIAGRRCVKVEMPWFDLEVNTGFLRTYVKPDANNGLSEHVFNARWDNPSLLPDCASSMGSSLSDDILKDIQHWSAKAGFLAIWCRAEEGYGSTSLTSHTGSKTLSAQQSMTGLVLLVPETFEQGLGMTFPDWYANLTQRVYRAHKLPQVIPYMRVTDPTTGIVSHTIGRDLTLERERAARPVEA